MYWLGYAAHYHATRLNNKDGQNILGAQGALTLDAWVARMHYATAAQWLNGQLVWDVMVPYVDASLNVGTGPQHKSGLGDIEWGPALAYHHSANLHTAVALHVQHPTGSYDPASDLNLGHNYTSVMPIYSVSYINPTGVNADLKLTGSWNTKNRDRDYKSGSELVADYTLGYAVTPQWVWGVGGYARQQVTDDKGTAAPTDGYRARAVAIGPSFIYKNEQGFYVTAKYHVESKVQNTWQGKALWFKATLPF